jgi:hypothetical protein
LGYGTLILAVCAFSASVWQIHTKRTLEAHIRHDAAAVLVDTLTQVTSRIYLAGADQHAYGLALETNELSQYLRRAGERVGKIAELYKDGFSEEQRKIVFEIQVMLTEQSNSLKSPSWIAREFLGGLDSEISAFIASVEPNPTKRPRIPDRPLRDALDFDHPEPDSSIR